METPDPVPSKAPEPARPRRRRKIVLWILVSVPIALVLAWWTWDRLGAATLSRKISQLEAAGFKTSLAALESPPVAVSDNAAPFYERAFARLTKPENEKSLRQIRQGGLSSVSAEERAGLEAWITENKDVFRLLEEAQSRPSCRFELNPNRLVLARLPESFKAFELADFLGSWAQFEASLGRHPSARQAVAHILRLSDALGTVPLLGVELYRAALAAMGMKTLEMCIEQRTSESELGEWLSLVPQDSTLDGMTEGMVRTLICLVCELSRDDLRGFRDLASRDPARHPAGFSIPSPLKPALYFDLARDLEGLVRLAEAAKKPHPLAAKEFDSIMKEVRRPRSWLNSKVEFVSLASLSFNAEAGMKARLAVVRAGIGFERSHLATGRYPASTDVRDPFTERPLRYDPKRGLIYSARDGDPEEDEDPSIRWTLKRR